MTWNGYIAIENLNLNASQRQTLIDELRTLGPASAKQPAHLNHWRVRLDGEAAIFEAAFSETALTIESFKRRLGAIFGISWVTIEHAMSSVTFAVRPTPVVVFSRAGTDYLRFAAFAVQEEDDVPTGEDDVGPWLTAWDKSRLEALAYLAANRDDWESEIE